MRDRGEMFLSGFSVEGALLLSQELILFFSFDTVGLFVYNGDWIAFSSRWLIRSGSAPGRSRDLSPRSGTFGFLFLLLYFGWRETACEIRGARNREWDIKGYSKICVYAQSSFQLIFLVSCGS